MMYKGYEELEHIVLQFLYISYACDFEQGGDLLIWSSS